MRKFISIFLVISLLLSFNLIASASDDDMTDGSDTVTGAEEICKSVKSAVLMDASTGTVIFEKDGSVSLPPASVTKVMTLLLVAEALEKGSITPEQEVTVSSYAASMGGSQVFLSEGEEFTVEELLKCAIIASANDASVALAELIGGTEQSFVSMMNDRAKQLGLTGSHFENCTGLDDEVVKHELSALDIAKLSRELINYPIVMKYTRIWQDSIRDGEFVLTNTNRLVRYYKGCTGLKTGSTDKAGFCVSATAERDGMHLIAVVMGAETREARNECARALLDFGFSGFSLYSDPSCELEKVPITHGNLTEVAVLKEGFFCLVKRSDIPLIEKKYFIPDKIDAPFEKGDVIGRVEYYLENEKLGECGIVASAECSRIGIWDIFVEMIMTIITG